MRKRITQVFPFLIPLRVWERKLFYFMKMRLDSNHYSKTFGELLPYEVCKLKTRMINENSGQDIIYQQNKVDNLKILSKTMNRILIYPGEVFSFCYLEKNSKKYGTYKDGLVFVDGAIVPRKGGGICHLSNLLYHLFLLSPLEIVERHGHQVKSFPNPDSNSLDGVDATINSGWLDLKVKNTTNQVYQILIDFDEEYMYGSIFSDQESFLETTILNDNFKYIRKNGKVYESVSIIKITKDKKNHKESREKLYDEVVEVGYELPNNILVEEIK